LAAFQMKTSTPLKFVAPLTWYTARNVADWPPIEADTSGRVPPVCS